MKKLITTLLIITLALTCVFAGDFKFLFNDLDQHTEILGGFLPTLIEIGVGYGNDTQIQLSAGGGYTQRVLYQDPVTGAPLKSNQLIYDVTQARWNLKFIQDFDNISIFAGYSGRYEYNSDSMVKGKERFTGYKADGKKGKSTVPSISDWFGTSLNNNKIYPDVADDKEALIHSVSLGFGFGNMDDQMVSNRGYEGEVKVQYAPSFLNKDASFLSATFNFVAGTTLLEKSRDGLNLFSVVLIDRFNANWTDGDKVPAYISRPVSLGRKVRGFETNTYNTNMSFVNNLDLRFAGQELFCDGIFPRLNLFVDVGYHFGNYLNTGHNNVKAVKDKNFLASTGAQIEVCFFDVIDLGFQVSYLLAGENWKTPGEKIITGATFFLDF